MLTNTTYYILLHVFPLRDIDLFKPCHAHRTSNPRFCVRARSLSLHIHIPFDFLFHKCRRHTKQLSNIVYKQTHWRNATHKHTTDNLAQQPTPTSSKHHVSNDSLEMSAIAKRSNGPQKPPSQRAYIKQHITKHKHSNHIIHPISHQQPDGRRRRDLHQRLFGTHLRLLVC